MIHPEIYAQNLSNLQLIAKQIVEGFIIGRHSSPHHGYSVEYAEHKQYLPGDALKHIDWKLLGKTGKLFSKKYEQETNLRCYFLLDISNSMNFPNNKNILSKLDFSIIATSALLHILKKQVDAVSLTTFAQEIIEFLPCKSSNSHYQFVNQNLYDLMIAKQNTYSNTNIIQAIEFISQRLKNKSLVVLFSDFFDENNNTTLIFEKIKLLKTLGHEIIIFHVYDQKLENELLFENKTIEFIDVETNEKLTANPLEIRTEYMIAKNNWDKTIQDYAIQNGIDFVKANIQESFSQILYPFLSKRK